MSFIFPSNRPSHNNRRYQTSRANTRCLDLLKNRLPKRRWLQQIKIQKSRFNNAWIYNPPDSFKERFRIKNVIKRKLLTSSSRNIAKFILPWLVRKSNGWASLRRSNKALRWWKETWFIFLYIYMCFLKTNVQKIKGLSVSVINVANHISNSNVKVLIGLL